MKADDTRGDGSGWPRWLEPLRPDPLSRRRIRQNVMERARPLLAGRRPERAWEVAAGWADVLVPVAAVASVLFLVVAQQSGGGALGPAASVETAERQGVRIEELLADPGQTEPPTLLTRSTQPDLDGLLEAAIYSNMER